MIRAEDIVEERDRGILLQEEEQPGTRLLSPLGARGRRTRGSERCNNLGESYSAGAGKPLMNFEL